MTSDPKIKQALERLKLSSDAYTPQVKREKADLAFQIPENQWPDGVKDTRKAQTIDGIVLPERPSLSIPTLDQPIQLALNQERQAHLGVQVHPLTEDADDDTAEVLQGLYRRIETDSRANLARSWAHERAVKCGRGWYRVNKVLDRDSSEKSDQKLVIQRILRQESVYPDPFAQEPDWSDGRFLFVVSWWPASKFKAKYPKAKLHAMDQGDIAQLAEEAPEWVRGEGEGLAFCVAEYFCVEEAEDGARTVFWSTIDAIEELEPEQEWDGQWIPLIPTIGRELIPFDAERRWVGIISNNKDGARLVNYAASGLVEAAALETKTSVAVDPEAIENFEEYWKTRHLRNWPYLPKRRFKGGRDLGPVEYIQSDMSKMQMNAMLLEQGREFVRIGTGAFEPALGEDSSRQQSGRKVLALKGAYDESNSNWLDNLSQISMDHESRVVLDLIPKIYDRSGRVAMILDIEDTPKQVVLNQPFVQQGKRAVPLPNGPDGAPMMPPGVTPKEVKHFDLTKGRYGVTISVGKGYKSRVEQGADELGQLFQAEPQLFSLLGDIYLKFRDFPGHTEAAERMKKMLPPPLQDKDGQQQDMQAMQQQLQQAGQQIQMLSKELEKRVEQIQTDQVKQQAQVQMKQLEAELKVKLQEMQDATSIRIAEINAATKGYQTEAQHAAQHEAQALDIQAQAVQSDLERENTTHEAERQRQHEDVQAAVQREHDLTTGQQQIEGQIAVTKAKPQPKAGGPK